MRVYSKKNLSFWKAHNDCVRKIAEKTNPISAVSTSLRLSGNSQVIFNVGSVIVSTAPLLTGNFLPLPV